VLSRGHNFGYYRSVVARFEFPQEKFQVYGIDHNFCAGSVKRFECQIYLLVLPAPFVELSLTKCVSCWLVAPAFNHTSNASG
jgi:hypothetical protein